MAKKPTAVKAKRERKPAPSLSGEAKTQLDTIGKHATALLEAVNASTLVPNRHIYETKNYVSQQLRAILKSRKADPKVRRRATLERKIAEAQAKLRELEQAS